MGPSSGLNCFTSGIPGSRPALPRRLQELQRLRRPAREAWIRASTLRAAAPYPWVSHSASPEHAARDAETRRFYSDSPKARERFLEEVGAAHVVVPRAWPNGGLPPDAPFRRRLEVDGPAGGLAVHSRTPAAGPDPR